MENPGIQKAIPTDSKDALANDVALLYSWAKLENTPYRDFSRQRPRISSPFENEGAKPERSAVSHDSQTATIDPKTVTGVSSDVSMVAKPNQPGSGETAHEADKGGPVRRQDADISPTSESPSEKRVVPSGVRQMEPSGPRPTVVAVFSIAGGVGKTSICANVGKILCSLGEQVLLVEATSRGFLPFYFGATEPRSGLRKFLAPGSGKAELIHVVSGQEISTRWLDRDVKHLMRDSERTIIDLGQVSEDLLEEFLRMCSVVIVPLLPDLNSIVTVARIESLLHSQAMGPNPADVFYFFNRFDEHRRNDQRARAFVEEHCGQRLLPISLRDDAELRDALCAGLSGVADQTPGAELSRDYLELALWVRRVAPISSAVLVPGRWSEQ